MSWLAWTISMKSPLLNNTSFPFYWLSSLIIITRLTLKIIKTGESLGQTRTLYGWFYQKIFLRCYCIFNLVLKIVARHAYQIGKRRVLETYYSTAKIHVEGLTFYISYNRRCASLHVIMFYSLLPSRGKCQKWLMQVWYLLLCVSFVDEMLLLCIEWSHYLIWIKC